MNIYALSGHRVVVTEDTKNNGYASDKKKVAELLEVGKEYVVDYTIVDGWHTDVYLKRFDAPFNCVNFEDVTEQSEEDDMLHDDWATYN